jgi:hypothetical protein
VSVTDVSGIDQPPSFKGLDGWSLDVYGTWDATFPIDDTDEYAWLLDSVTPPRRDVRFAYREGGERACPACREPVKAVVLESVVLVPSDGVRDGEGVRFTLSGVDPTAVRCEPCGHRFDRDGEEIDTRGVAR